MNTSILHNNHLDTAFTSFQNFVQYRNIEMNSVVYLLSYCSLASLIDSFKVGLLNQREISIFKLRVNQRNLWELEIRELLGVANVNHTAVQQNSQTTIVTLNNQYAYLESIVGRSYPSVQESAKEKSVVLSRIPIGSVLVPIISDSSKSALVIYGKGPVGKQVFLIAERCLIKSLNVGRIRVMKESEITSTMKQVKTIILAVDGIQTEGKDLFGRKIRKTVESELDKSALQKLLNSARMEMDRANSDVPIKVVLLGSACKPPHSAASMLLGDHTNIERECILLCKQRGLAYNIVKVGKIVDDSYVVSGTGRLRAMETELFPSDSAATSIKAPLNSLVITLEAGIEHTEFTYRNIAAEALFRAASHQDKNASFSVLSVPTSVSGAAQANNCTPSEELWADSFLKIVGPELLRLPLRFPNTTQALQRVHSWGLSVASVQSVRVTSLSGVATAKSLITPVQVEVCENGLRVLFNPARGGAYRSSKETKREGARRGEEGVKKPHLSSDSESQTSLAQGEPTSAGTRPGMTGKNAQEGGLEVLVEADPYPRVRVRRCAYGPGAVVKEESEVLLLQALQRALTLLEMEHKPIQL